MSEPCAVEKESPIDIALGRLKSNIGATEETMTRFETTLASVLTEPEKSTKEGTPETQAPQTSLETALTSMGNDVSAINDYLREVQNRVQL